MTIFKQIDEIVFGAKTQTRRCQKPAKHTPDGMLIGGEFATDNDGETVVDAFGNRVSDQPIHTVWTQSGIKPRVKWQVGRDYSVQPKMYQPGVWWNPSLGEWQQTRPGVHNSWRPLRYRITEIRHECVQAISEADALAEGYPIAFLPPHKKTVDGHTWPPIFWYRKLWTVINTRKGTRWEDNPQVWVLTFEVVC